MTNLSDFWVVDNVTDVLAAQYNRVIDATLRGELANSETLAADKTLVDADFALQVYTPTAARIVNLPAAAGTNHPFYIVNASATYGLTVQDAGATVIGIVPASSSGLFGSNATGWFSLAAKPAQAPFSASKYLGQDGQFHEIPTTTSLFASNTASPISGYKSLTTTLPTGSVANTATSITAADTVVEEFFAAAGVFDLVSEQVLHCHTHLAKTGGTKNATAYVKVYSRTAGGTETLMGTSETTANLAGTETQYDFSIPVSDTIFAATDVIGYKIFASPVGGGSNPTVTTYYEGTTAARLEVGASAVVSGGGVVSGPDGFMDNGVISVTVSGNNLTVAIKTIAGADPSAGSPVKVRIGNVYRSITSALSVTKNAATNWCNAGSAELATKEIDYFVYLGYNATDGVTIGFSRISFANLYSDFSTTTTNEKYAAISTITNAAAGDSYVNIGRFAATLSAGAGYTWSVPTFTNTNLIQRPIFETRELLWVPTIVGFGATPPSTTYYGYKIDNKALTIVFDEGTAGTSTGTSFTATLPFGSLAGYGGSWVAPALGVDNGNTIATPILALVDSGVSLVRFFTSWTTAAWTAANGKRVTFLNLTYLIG